MVKAKKPAKHDVSFLEQNSEIKTGKQSVLQKAIDQLRAGKTVEEVRNAQISSSSSTVPKGRKRTPDKIKKDKEMPAFRATLKKEEDDEPSAAA